MSDSSEVAPTASAESKVPEPSKLLVTRIMEKVTVFAMVLCGLSIGLMATHIIIDVIARNIFSYSLHDTLAFVSYLWMPLIAYLALGACQIRGEHITVGLLVDSVGPKTRRVVEIVADVIAAGLLLYMSILAFQAVQESIDLDERVGLQRWLMLWPVKLVVAVGMVLFVLAAICTIAERAINRTRFAQDLEETHDGSVHGA